MKIPPGTTYPDSSSSKEPTVVTRQRIRPVTEVSSQVKYFWVFVHEKLNRRKYINTTCSYFYMGFVNPSHKRILLISVTPMLFIGFGISFIWFQYRSLSHGSFNFVLLFSYSLSF